LQISPLESSCVVVAHIENYSNSKSLKISTKKSQILSCHSVVANERYVGFTLFGDLALGGKRLDHSVDFQQPSSAEAKVSVELHLSPKLPLTSWRAVG